MVNQQQLRPEPLKSKEIIFKRSWAKGEPGQLPDIKRVQEITLLGVSVNNKLQVTQHISTLIKKCNSTMYAIKILKSKGLECTKHIYRSLIIGKMTYAIPAWWGMTTKKRPESFI